MRVTAIVLVEHHRLVGLRCNGVLEGEVRRAILVMDAAAGEIVVVKLLAGGDLPHERIRERDDGRQLVWVADDRESLRAIRQRQRGGQAALTGFVDDRGSANSRRQRAATLHAAVTQGSAALCDRPRGPTRVQT